MTEDRFKNRLQAYAWLAAEGFTVSEKTFYNACTAGQVTVYADKTVSKFSVAEYGRRLKTAVVAAPNLIEKSERKSDLELRNLELDVQKKEIANRKEDANWLPKEEAWAQMAAIIGVLRDSLRHQFHVGSVAVIHAAGGDPARAPEVYEQTEELISRAFNEVVNAGRIEGIFAKGENE